MATMFGSTQKKMTASDAAAPVAPAVLRKDAEPDVPRPTMNLITEGTVIEGNIVADGDLIVEGTVRGDVTTRTRLIVGPASVVEGNIFAEQAEVAGRVRGTVQASGLLIIKASSVIDGDVITKNLNVESGSTFNGRFQVGGKVESVAKPAVEAPKKESIPVAAKA
ncbi:MAG TPA: polymer-forming cytoskeletal protein [Planctomycetaceae bacterium]|nr:polymer-forming cytoskeletal protein [Planctomycetaceae bacterium]